MGVMRVVLNDSGRQRDAWIILDGGKKTKNSLGWWAVAWSVGHGERKI